MRRKDIISTIVSTIIIFSLCVFGACISANAQTNYKCENKTFSSVKTTSVKSSPEKTDFLWKDSKGHVYPIYISSTGSCFILRISSKTNKEYKQYLGEEISREICNKLDREYITKKKQ